MLWRIAEAFLNMLHALFGAPEEIAAKHTLTRHARGFLLSWIASAEALLRRLLIIEAAACPKPEPGPRLARRRTHKRTAYTFDPEQPEAWRVGFRCFSSSVRGPSFSARTPKSETQEQRFYAARPRLLQKDCRCEKREKSGLIISHTGFSLEYVHADRGHILLNGKIYCYGHPQELLADIKKYGYEECAKCQR